MERQLSSSLTFFFKYILIFLWVCIFGLEVRFLFEQHDHERFSYLWGWLFVTLIIYFFTCKLKAISIVSNNLIISNYFTEIQIPLKDISYIYEFRTVNCRPIKIVFNKTTIFGNSIIFIPTGIICSLFKPHPIYVELEENIKLSKKP